MFASLVSHLIGLPEFKGKGTAIRQALRLIDGQAVRSRYGPLMRVRAGDLTNFFCISGRNASEYGDVYEELTRSLKPGMAFLDIGANVGLFSLIASRIVGASGVVVAFEPSLSVFSDLVGNAALNGLRNFFPFNLAISKTTSLTRFQSGSTSHTGVGHISESGDIAVLQVDLGDMTPLLDTLLGDRPIVMKIDVEGAEAWVLEGLRSFLATHNVVKAVVEISPDQLARFGSTPEDVYQAFEAAGFTGQLGRGARTHYNEVFVRAEA